METLGDRIRLRRGKMRQGELAEKLGVNRVALIQWEKNQKQANHENLIRLSQVLGVTVDWLLMGGKESFTNVSQVNKGKEVNTNQKTIVFHNLDIIPFPEMHELKVVEGRAAADLAPAFAKSKETVWVDKRYSSDSHYGIVVHGSSMANTICEGDIAIVRKQGWVLEEFDPERGAALLGEWKRLHNKIVLARVNDDEPLCKRIQILDLPKSKVGFFIQLCSDNCQSPPKPIWQTDRLEILGIVVSAVRIFERGAAK